MKTPVKSLVLFSLAAAFPVLANGFRGIELVFGSTPRGDYMPPTARQTVALLADGGYAVVWTELSADLGDVRLQLVRADGSEVFEAGGRPIAGFPADENDAAVAAHATSGAFVALRRTGGGDGRIFVQSFDHLGTPRWPDGGVAATAEAPPLESQEWPQLVASADGGVFVCFAVADSATSDTDIACQRFDAGGRRLWSDRGRQAGGRPGWQFIPLAIGDGADGLLVFWRNLRLLFPEDNRRQMRLQEGQRFSPAGLPLWGSQGRVLHTTRLEESNGEILSSFSAVPDGSGGAVLAFLDWNGRRHRNLDVLAQRVSRNGETLWGNGVVVAAGPQDNYLDSLTAGPNGGAFVAVREGLGISTVLRLYRLGPDGRHRWPARGRGLSDLSRAGQDYNSYGSFDGDRLRLVWNRHLLGAGPRTEVRLAVFDRFGRRYDDPRGAPVTDGGRNLDLKGFAFDPRRGQGLAVWNYFSFKPDPPVIDADTGGVLFAPP